MTQHQAVCSEETETEKVREEAQSSSRRQKAAEYAKRVLVLVVGLAVMSFGVALSIRASLGTSPISGIPYVLNLISGLSVLRRRFRPIALLQIPVCILFGLLTDLALLCITNVQPAAYWAQWLICLCGILLVAVGVSCEVAANVTTLPGEGTVLALCTLFPKAKFGYMKVAVDVSLVVIAASLSFLFLRDLQGVREGTVAAAILVGLLAKLFNRVLHPLTAKFFASEK